VSRPLATVAGVALVAAALVAAYIGAGDVIEAITGRDQDSPTGVLLAVGAAFLLAAGVLAWLGLAALGRGPRRRGGG
jgi:hypothetical protein